jgi:formate hydrogenlyase transcriptional activator
MRLSYPLDSVSPDLESATPSEQSRPVERELESFERLISDISSQFGYLHVDELPGAIAGTLQQIVEVLEVDRSTVFEFSESGGTIEALHFWAKPGVAPMRRDDAEALDWYLGRLRRGEVVRLASLEGMLPAEADVERDYVRKTGIKSNLSVPILIGGRLVAALAVGSFERQREWPDPLVDRVRLIAQIIAAALQRRRHELALRASLHEIERLNQQLRVENLYLHEEIKNTGGFDEIVGTSEVLRMALVRVEQVAPIDSTVLLLGESGTGKELFARAVHDRSPRRKRPLVSVNCAALPSSLIESELFGHEKGAFTGATAPRYGRFEVADGGTLFLDEVGDLALDLQSRLLRVLQNGEFERVGSSHTRRVDVRLITATHRDLDALVRAGSFRTDLYYRLSVFPIVLPPLRDRPEDIPELVWFFVARHQRRIGRRIERVSRATMHALQRYDWPGNVRELQNVIERAMILSTGGELQINETFSSRRPSATGRAADRTLASAERAHLEAVLEECGWLINGPGHAAEKLDLHPNTVRFRMKKLGIKRPERPGARSQ